MTAEELIKRLKELRDPGTYPCDNEYKQIRRLVLQYEKDNHTKKLESCFKQFMPWEKLSQQLKELIDKRADFNEFHNYIDEIDFSSDIFWININGYPEHVDSGGIDCLIRSILSKLEDNDDLRRTH